MSSAGIIETTDKNPRGIPTAPFISDVQLFAPTRDLIPPALQKFAEMIAKYQFMSQSTLARASSLRSKIPDILKTLETVRFLRAHPDAQLEAHYELNDTVYAKAKTLPLAGDGGEEKEGEVYLWLGANVMLAYPLSEAEELLDGKLKAARESLKAAEEDAEFARAQITTLEVNTARLYNWEVTLKRRERDEEEQKKK